MLAEPKIKSLSDLLNGATRDELIWISGYIAALTGQPVPEKLAGELAPSGTSFTALKRVIQKK